MLSTRSVKLFLNGIIILSTLIFNKGLCNGNCYGSPSQEQEHLSIKVSSEEIGNQLKDWILRMKNFDLEVSTNVADRKKYPKHWIHFCVDKGDFEGMSHLISSF